MRRRVFIPAFGASLFFARSPARAADESLHNVGVLMNGDPAMQVGRENVEAFETSLANLGWTEGRNLHLEYRWGGGDGSGFARGAAELVAMAPEVILAATSPAAHTLRDCAGAIPIVFVVVTDPAGQGLVNNLARPEGTLTGLSNYDAPLALKWLTLLKEIVPALRLVAAIFDPVTATYAPHLVEALSAFGPSLGVEVRAGPFQSRAEIGRIIEMLEGEPGCGLLTLPDNSTTYYRDSILALTARHKVPAIYPYTYFAREGGLAAYGVVFRDLFRRAATYIDRILKGAKPAELPVEAPTRFEFALNLKAARALGITFPPMLLARADEVIE